MNESSQRVPRPKDARGGVLDPASLQGLRGLGGSTDPDLPLDLVELSLDEAARMDLDAVASGADVLRPACATIGYAAVHALFKSADESVYSAKRSGRNQIRFASELKQRREVA